MSLVHIVLFYKQKKSIFVDLNNNPLGLVKINRCNIRKHITETTYQDIINDKWIFIKN